MSGLVPFAILVATARAIQGATAVGDNVLLAPLDAVEAVMDKGGAEPVIAVYASHERQPMEGRNALEGKRRLEGRAAETLAKHRDAIEAYEAFADELGHEPGDIALAWLLSRPGVTGPIIGPRTREQLDAGIRALDVTLDDAALARLDEIFPGHKPAPEDYAW